MAGSIINRIWRRATKTRKATNHVTLALRGDLAHLETELYQFFREASHRSETALAHVFHLLSCTQSTKTKQV